MPKVTLISYTPNAENILIFTKSTRLNMDTALLETIAAMPMEDKLKELEYMSNTIPSSWEFVDFVFSVERVSRAYTHQQVRTRSGSYAQQTMRILNMDEFKYIYSDKMGEHPTCLIVDEAIDKIKSCYRSLIRIGVPPEDARGILPTNISTNIVCKFNLRTFAELAKSRTGGRTQSEYQEIINIMIDKVLDVYPWVEMFLFNKGRNVFDDIESFAVAKFPDLKERGELLKLVDKLRKELG